MPDVARSSQFIQRFHEKLLVAKHKACVALFKYGAGYAHQQLQSIAALLLRALVLVPLPVGVRFPQRKLHRLRRSDGLG
jgi:hypothetical protein